jgi:hypothetical protein
MSDLSPLEPFVGTWQLQASVGGEALGGTAHTTFGWLEDRAFLAQHANAEVDESWPEEWVANSPFPTTTIVGLDDADGSYTQLYADGRGVHRVYRMTFDGRVWKVWREAPGFNQRFTGTFSDDGTVITAAWEMSEDGETWTTDFEVTYTKVGP